MSLHRVVLPALLVALWSGPAAAFEGRVVRRDGSPVSGAEVSVVGRAGLARTDTDGLFTWSPDPTPPFELLVLLPGGQLSAPIRVGSLPQGAPLHIEPASLAEAVTVTSGVAPGIEGSPASADTLLPAREFAVRQPTNLAQLLENVAGVSQVSEGQAAVPAIRGLARGRTLILIDGARVSAERRVGPAATYLDPAVLESVEVSRGPATVAYGSDAFGGVINARTRGAAPASGFGGRFLGSLGRGVPERRASLELRQGFATGGLLAQAHWRDADDYDSPQGEVFNSGYRDYGFRARADRYSGNRVLNLSWQADFGRDVERPRTNSRTVRFFNPTEDSQRLTASYEAERVGGFTRLGANAFFGTYAVVTDQDRFASARAARSVERADVSAKDFHARAFAERPVGAARLAFGADVNGRFGLEALDSSLRYAVDGALQSTQTNVSIADARRADAALYATVESNVARALALSGGLRADRVTSRNVAGFFGDRSTTHSAVSGFASAVAGPFGGFTLTAQVARGFRDPVLSDRYYRGPTGRGFITGNPDLDPEASLQLDAGVRFTAPGVRVALNAYQYRFRDLIERYETTTDFFFFRNRGRARLRGVELELHARPRGGWDLLLTGHVVRGLALDDGADLDDTPPDTLTLEVRKSFAERAFVQARGAFYAEHDRPGPTEQAREGYTLVDLSGGVTVAANVELRLLLRNVFDDEHLVSPDSRAVLAPGRSAVLTAVIGF